MCEVTKSNFKEEFQNIEKSLRKAVFVAIDSEFSGLVSHSKLKNSLFDTSGERYLKLKCSIEQFMALQIGLAIFHYCREENKYTADVYSFYIFPCSFGPVDTRFLCQASSWEFLRAHNFDFNKVAYEGVPFLSLAQESQVRKLLDAGTMFSNVERMLSYRDEDDLQAACSKVAQWLPTAGWGAALTLLTPGAGCTLVYFMHKEIRTRFRDVWTFDEPEKVIVRKLRNEEISKAKEAEGKKLDCELLDSLLGFSKVFKLLVDLKPIIVGHNLLLDLMILYNQLFEPLPGSYAVFKKKIHEMFPSIFDTKFVSYRVRDILRYRECWSSNSLDQLYLYFDSMKGKSLASFTPKVDVLQNNVKDVEKHAHEAAWDAYMCGYCFIRLAHFLAVRHMGENALPRALTRVEHIAAISEYNNLINVIRGSVSHMNFGGEEPLSNRPRLLYMQRRDGKPVDLQQVTAMMATHGSVDVKAHSVRSVLIAVSSWRSARDIVIAFNKDKTFKVVHYSSIMHNSLVMAALWGTLAVTGSLCASALVYSFIAKK